MHKKIILILIIAILLSGCAVKPAEITSAVKEINNKPMEVYFCPQDNCSWHLINLINSANKSIYCAFYDIDLPGVIQALQNKKIDVKLIVDNSNYDNVKGLDFAKADNSSALMHNKFCIIDDRAVSTGSFNPTFYGDNYNNNNFLIIYSEYLVQNYKQEFNELWKGDSGKGMQVKCPLIYLNGIKMENYFCPEDNCAEHVIEELKKAEESIYFMAFTFTHDGIANILALKLSENITVRGVVEKSRQSKYSRFDFLQFQGAEMHYDKNPKTMHHKVFIIDNETVITGSFNPTWSGDNRNDENILVIHDKGVAGMFLGEFEKNFKKP